MEIRNGCSSAPRGLLSHVRRSLSWINPLDLDGIAYIQLKDGIEEPTPASPKWHQQAKEEGTGVYGIYFRRWTGSPAYITLFIQDLYYGIPSFYWWTTVPTLNISRTLAHEVGHHLIATRGFIYQPDEKYKHAENEEDFCNRYAFSVIKRMIGRWHYRLGNWAIKDLAGWHYIIGCLDWRDKKYKKAAEHWDKAWRLDPDRTDALRWYWRAKDLQGGGQEQV